MKTEIEIENYFLDTDFSFTNQNECTQFCTAIQNVLLKGSVSKNFGLCLSYFFMNRWRDGKRIF